MSAEEFELLEPGPVAPALDPKTVETLRDLERRSGVQLVHDLVQLFLNIVPLRMEAIRGAIADGDNFVLEKTAHAFRSSAGNVGAMRLAHLCEQFENAGKKGRAAAGLELLFEELVTETRRVSAALNELIAKV